MQYKVVVFEPNKEGKVMTVRPEDYAVILGGTYEIEKNKHGLDFTEVIVNKECILFDLPYNRGYFGTFILAKRMGIDESSSFELTKEEIEEIKETLDYKPNFESKNSSYLAKFFEKRNLRVEFFSYYDDVKKTTISNYDVIHAVLNTKDKMTIETIENTIENIDYKNHDINAFLKELGKGLAIKIFRNFEEIYTFD